LQGIGERKKSEARFRSRLKTTLTVRNSVERPQGAFNAEIPYHVVATGDGRNWVVSRNRVGQNWDGIRFSTTCSKASILDLLTLSDR